MKSLRVCLSLILLGLVLSFGFARLARAEEESQKVCNCYLPNTGQYGTLSPDRTYCMADDFCFLELD